jgi:outer membrane protein insertion porin family
MGSPTLSSGVSSALMMNNRATRSFILGLGFWALLFPGYSSASTLLSEVRIQGNLRVEEDGIRLNLQTQKGQPFDPQIVDEDIKAIYRMGFFDDVNAELSPDGVLTYTVTERPYVKEVEILGNAKIDTDKITNVLGVKPRTILDRGRLEEGVERVRRLYGEGGYVNAKIDYAVSPAENNQAVITLDVVEGKLLLIKKIVFEGNETFSDSELKGLMATKEDWIIPFTSRGVLDSDVLTNDTAMLSAFYYDHGFIDHRIDEPIILRKSKGLQVVIRVQEGERYRVGSVRIGGDLIDDPKKLLDTVELTAGQIFRGSRLRNDMTTLTERYANRGFAFAEVEPRTQINPEGRLVDVAFIIKSGPPVYFDKVVINGNTKTRDNVIRRELETAEKERFSSDKIKESRNALQRTGYFKDVKVSTKKGEKPGMVDLLVDVEEGPTGTFSVGAGYSTGNSFSFTASLSERNLFGTGRRVSANLEIGSIDQDIVISFTEPHVLGSRADLSLDVYNTESEFNDFTSGRTGFGVRVSSELRYVNFPYFGRYADRNQGDDFEYQDKSSIMDHLRGGIAYSFSRDKISDVGDDAPVAIAEEEGTSLTSAIVPSIAFDTRNHFFAPTEGTKSSLGIKFAGLGGDNQFIKNDAQIRWYYPILQNYKWAKDVAVMLGGNVGYGFAWSRFNNSDDLPLSDRYFPGGTNSVRGFEQRTLGPKQCKQDEPDCDDPEPVGGSKQLIMNAELHFPVLEKWGLRGFAFFDQGQAFEASKSLSIADLKRSLGIGALWQSPFGPLKVSLGFALNADEFDKTEIIGFSFGGGAGN